MSENITSITEYYNKDENILYYVIIIRMNSVMIIYICRGEYIKHKSNIYNIQDV